MYYRSAIVAIICCDLTDSSSFYKGKFWVNELRKQKQNCAIFLCGTKLDLIQKNQGARQVDYCSLKDFADEIHAKVYEISSKSGENVEKLFHDVAKTCLEKVQANGFEEMLSLKLEEPRKQKRCRCR